MVRFYSFAWGRRGENLTWQNNYKIHHEETLSDHYPNTGENTHFAIQEINMPCPCLEKDRTV